GVRQLAGWPGAARRLPVRSRQHPASGGPGHWSGNPGQPAGDAALRRDDPGAGVAVARCHSYPAVRAGVAGSAVESRALNALPQDIHSETRTSCAPAALQKPTLFADVARPPRGTVHLLSVLHLATVAIRAYRITTTGESHMQAK